MVHYKYKEEGRRRTERENRSTEGMEFWGVYVERNFDKKEREKEEKR